MRLRLVVRMKSADARWERRVERSYEGVPSRGDWVHLAEGSDGLGLFAQPVASVTWENDGAVTLVFDVIGDEREVAGQMQSLGFTRV